MNLGRVVMVFTLLPLTIALERFAYYGSRSMLSLHLHGALNMDAAQIGRLYTFQAIAMAVCALLGGLLAVAVTPAVTLALGMIVAALGHVLLTLTGSEGGIWVSAGAIAFGVGLLRPSTYALAAAELPAPNEQLRNAAFVVLYAASNLSALGAPSAAATLVETRGPRVAFGSSAIVMAIAAFVAAGLAVGWFVIRGKRQADEPGASRRIGRLLAGGAGLLVIGSVFTLLLGFTNGAQYASARAASLPITAYSVVFGSNPIAVLVTAGLVLVASIALHFARVRLTALYVVAAGSCVAAAATLPVLLGTSSLGGLVAVSAVTGIAEVLLLPFALSRLLGDVVPRFAPAVIGVWVSVTSFTALLGNVVPHWLEGSERLLTALTAGVLFVIGAALVFTAAPIARALYE